MAMRPRGGGAGPRRAPRPAVRPVYEDFRPVSERHQEEEAEKLLIFLPGFMKENIRVSTEGKNTVRVRGERFVGGNKWHRFQEDFQAPDDCNMRGIHAKFENGILIVTMPWKMPKQLLDEPTKQPPMTTLPPSQKDDNVPPKTTHPTDETPRKPTPLKPTAQLPKPQNVDKDQDSRVKDKQGDEALGSAESSKTQKGDNVPPKTTYPTVEAQRKPTPLKTTAQMPKPQNADKDQDSRVKEKQRDEKKILDDQLRRAESSKTQKGGEDIDFPALRTTPLGKTSGEKEKSKDEKKILEGLVGRIEQKSKEKNVDQNRTQLVKSGKEVEKKESHDAGGKKVAEKSKDLREEFQEKIVQKGSQEKASTSNVAAGASSYPGSESTIGNLKKSLVELNEERQLLVNAGAAVLVIMALGAYVYHSIGSGRAE
ncbi:hypothetical protein HAX54_026989 [Datura stramonium]|uniref:SHSP domain-containing protein n=1 Tax=Datura stramonium TaxID=4076 RepID=A0ABS8S8C7_DATST|nr:hypothetical protein [Datura stramonium]